MGKGVVSRTWGKVKADWEGWNRRSLADDDIARLILEGTVVKVQTQDAEQSLVTKADSVAPGHAAAAA